jgi:type VI secretion system secreted protein VgrG
MLAFGACLYSPSAALARPVGSADGLAVLDASTITHSDSTIITGGLGLSPGTSITGLQSAAFEGTARQLDGTVEQAQIDPTAAYRLSALLPFISDLSVQNLDGLTLSPTVYRVGWSSQLTGMLAPDVLRNSNSAIYVLQTGDALRNTGDSVVRRLGGEYSRLTWQVGSSTALDPGDLGPGAMEDVPEPGTVGLFLTGFLALTLYGWQSRKR